MEHAVVPVMQSRGSTNVTTGSISGRFGEPALAAYTASETTVADHTRSLTIDDARSRTRANCVLPSWVDTGFNDP
jgi:NAD(P)-dependent dehydrogenase (short-subunit alcohol dehydrogenase family)